jgi:hypothetical protein
MRFWKLVFSAHFVLNLETRLDCMRNATRLSGCSKQQSL